MNTQKIFEEGIKEIIENKSIYPFDAYIFTRDAINFAIISYEEKTGTKGHISGQELLELIKKFALDLFGPMTIDVLTEWNIRETMDFGRIIFNMVEHQLISASPNDSIEDFKKGFNFHEAFISPFITKKSKLGSISKID